MLDINALKFDEKGLIPAIVVDAWTKKVLTLAYMNRESLEISLEKGLTCFYSRSRQELWLKGDTSGNYQHIVSITADCDNDALVVVVEKDGPACHTGTDSCFTKELYQSDDKHEFTVNGLYELLQGRKNDMPEVIKEDIDGFVCELAHFTMDELRPHLDTCGAKRVFFIHAKPARYADIEGIKGTYPFEVLTPDDEDSFEI